MSYFEIIFTIVLVFDNVMRIRNFYTHLYLKSPMRLDGDQLKRVCSWSNAHRKLSSRIYCLVIWLIPFLSFMYLGWKVCVVLTVIGYFVTIYMNYYAHVWIRTFIDFQD